MKFWTTQREFWLRNTLLLLTLVTATGALQAQQFQLPPYKDELFQYRGILETGFGGDYVKVAYDKYIEIHKRDVVLEREVQRKYVSEKPRWSKSAKRLTIGEYKMKYFAVGKSRGRAKFIVVYVHGSGGNRFQGVNDWTFGGNFNRIQNLVVRNGGLYLSPDFEDFEAKGAAQVKQLIKTYAEKSPGVPIFVACGSKGGQICWRLARDNYILPRLTGMLLFGSVLDKGFFKSAAFKRKLPIYFGHGSWDTVFPWKRQLDFFKRIKKTAPKYPSKFALFDTGTHGTPIRMTDWRLILNWMLKVKG